MWARSYNSTTSDYKSSFLHSLHLVHLVQTKTLLFIFLTFCLLAINTNVNSKTKKENKTIHYNSREGHDSLSINLGMKCNMTVGENIFLITSEANTKNIESFSTKYTEFTFLVIIYER